MLAVDLEIMMERLSCRTAQAWQKVLSCQFSYRFFATLRWVSKEQSVGTYLGTCSRYFTVNLGLFESRFQSNRVDSAD